MHVLLCLDSPAERASELHACGSACQGCIPFTGE